MKRIVQFRFLATLFAFLLPLTSQEVAAAEPPVAREKVIFQVSDAIPGKWNLTLNNARNVQDAIGKDKVDVEIVAYGPGIDMLKLESEVANRIDKALSDGVKIVACENTMRNMKLTQADMLPAIGYVPGGVVELMRKQKEGWAYIRP
ncbi:MAG: DsrE family protein [Nitrosomonadales bacterium]|nr:DsrE family protein [Nitrosomonadales bacterium]